MKKEEKKSASHSQDNSFGIASVVLGILSILSLSVQGVVLSIIALVFASQQNKRNPNKWSNAGKILSIIGLILSIILLVAAMIIYSKYPGLFPVPQLPA